MIVPVLNEAREIAACLQSLQSWRRNGHEVIVVDGGSGDDTAVRAAPLADRVLAVERGRAVQMNAGAAAASGDLLLFLHADTRLPEAASALLADVGTGDWGCFDVRLSGVHPMFRIIGAAIGLRARLSGIATGDQAIFVGREMFRRIGGYPPIALMEDVALSRRLRCIRRPICLRARAVTSSRRWERHGIVRTVLRMWCLRLAYSLGVRPEILARHYSFGGNG